ncbi:MBL fold metallo-hydrolase [Corynebacterium sp. TAE3-ERU12]|uniref:MBL fold metallo-hydrolase n=1 Tax=Corynebacterium sp. TAE3-ERU12 TaxID=2849491 RepID=UPI001C43AE00|nr:MBL fold metallo-hydrolase [Corynebacterium sp. TAE3-ERU12]MBV7295363.1 MBL fold metallo-hydrolase [Corynebacterium sp. TAE3-ERU12]
MEIIGFVAGPLGTNCYVVLGNPAHPGGPRPCLIIDPGMQAAAQVKQIVAEHNATPVAVVLTHGHIDHTRDAPGLANDFDIPVYLHDDDRFMFDDPMVGAPMGLDRMFDVAAMPSAKQVRHLPHGTSLSLAGIDFHLSHAPGHSPGSVLLRVDDPAQPVLFSGDVLFAGSIGRTDLPGSSPQQMMASLRDQVLPLADGLRVLPGHGPETTMAAERATNPFLAQIR